ncbi:hypothetical protein DFH06DRAFT_984622 [Mycena polygramma]|nr:hypothetical protein DFH06DRAFT_984622 [Mycena polygramma]
MGWGNIDEIALHLLARGVEFRLCLEAPTYRKPIRRRERATRYVGHQPTALDYADYETRRNTFFRSPRGRAALFAGGIIGRLARRNVPENIACLRPPDEVFESGVRLWGGQGQTAYWDDALTEDEIDLICGVYVVAIGQQKKAVSWWPKPSAFSSSGLNIGWWSPDCERWFQNRSKEIIHQQAEAYRHIEWKHKIRFFQKSREVAMANEKISAEYLTRKLV